MDSVTQAALGAVVGGVVAGRKLGRRALIIGAIAGTLPDLDVFISPFVSDTTRLMTHRSATHSLVIMPLLAALLAWRAPRLAARFAPNARGAPLTTRHWFSLFFWCFVTHIALDSLTVFGTQIWFPLSFEAFAFPIIFIIDPFYTLPLLATIVWILWRNPPPPKRRRIAVGGLAVGCAYLMFATLSKSVAVSNIDAALAARDDVQQRITYSSPLNAVLWQTIAMTQSGYWAADYSLLGCGVANVREVAAHPHRDAFIAAARDNTDIRRLLKFSQGFFRLRDIDGAIVFGDLRFGEHSKHPFLYRVGTEKDGRFEPAREVKRLVRTSDLAERFERSEFERLWKRIVACESDNFNGSGAPSG